VNASLPSDPLLDTIASLPVVQVHADRAEAIRTRCRAALESGHTSGGFPILEPAAGVACAAYALQLARLALRLSR
jgi:hypothetical protein